MKGIACILLAIIAVIICQVSSQAPTCTEDLCKRPSCVCSKSKPNIAKNLLPQIVLISTNGAVRAIDVDNYYKPSYFNRKNPNGCQIGATFFVSHEFTDYSKVHELYAKGFEIGSNSITAKGESDYWKTASVDLLVKEFGGQKSILSKFGAVSTTEIKGIRAPNLQLAGDNYYDALQNALFTYDNSWPTLQEDFWPYTLDYKSQQDCAIGPCPVNSHKGAWVAPLNDWKDQNYIPCATVQACQSVPTNENEILEWLKWNFNTVYTSTKAPFNLAVSPAVFGPGNPGFLPAYQRFLDYLATLKDVYIVNESVALDWMKNPKPIDDPQIFPCPTQRDHQPSLARFCSFEDEKPQPKYMTIYNTLCPQHYPNLDNPGGN